MHAKLLSGGQDDATHNRLGTAGLEGTGGTGRPGCGAGGRRRSLADNESTYHHTKHLRRRRYAGHRRDLPRHRWAAAEPGRHTDNKRRPIGCRRGAWPGFKTRAWPRCRWAAAGPGRTTSRRAERSSQRGRRAGRRPRAHQAARHHEQRHGRAAAHGHTKQPGPTTGSSTARNTSGAINTAGTPAAQHTTEA